MGNSHSYNISVTAGDSDTYIADGSVEWTDYCTVYIDPIINPVGSYVNILDLIKQEKKESTMLEKLVDMVFALNLSEADVDEFKKIIGMADWRKAVNTYILAKAVKEGLTAETLGFEED